jgi:hypothetical protein
MDESMGYLSWDGPLLPYSRSDPVSRTTLHYGQLKLLKAELKVLVDCCRRQEKRPADLEAFLVYAGVSPGAHLPRLARRFPLISFLLLDPRPFDDRLRRYALHSGGRPPSASPRALRRLPSSLLATSARQTPRR